MQNNKCTVLVATYNGAHFLDAQINSIIYQKGCNVSVQVSDDGSVDGTLLSLIDLQAKFGESALLIMKGPRLGYVRNFLSMLCNPNIEGSYYALSDQDDVWLPEKLKVALTKLQPYPDDFPVLYCGRTTLVDKNLKPVGKTPLFRRHPSFRNALTQNIAGGNTMVMNRAARNLIMKAGECVDVPVHDWWVYLVVTACGGKVIYDRHPYVLYRQHDNNMIGGGVSWIQRWRRLKRMCQGDFKEYGIKHVRALRRLTEYMPAEHRQQLDIFEELLTQPSCVSRLKLLHNLRIYRQTIVGTLSLYILIFFGF